ncbi:MAG: histidine phosphatase family protein [Dehalococcoidia bacterium]
MRLLLVRHGESEGNAGRIFQGRTDYGLTPLGESQAGLTAERLRPAGVTAILASPLSRAFDTAAIVATALGIDVEVNEALLEYDIGEISGLSLPQVRERFPNLLERWGATGERPQIPGEEGRAAFVERVTAFVHGLDWKAEGTVVAVTHGGVVNVACYAALGLDFPDFFRPRLAFAVGNCSITELRGDPLGRIVLAGQNDTCHLDGVA